MKTKRDAKAGTDRRGFLKLAGLGSVGAGAAAVVARPENADAAKPSETAAGYRETEHVRTFYDTARF